MNEKMRLLPADTLRFHLPSKSVTVPAVVPSTRMATPGSGCPVSSTTVPDTLRVWAIAHTPDSNSRKDISATLAPNGFPCFVFVVLCIDFLDNLIVIID